MNIAWILLYTLITHGLEIVIFFKVDGIGLTFERIFKAFLQDTVGFCFFNDWLYGRR